MDVFSFALEQEKLAEEFYRKLATQTLNKGLQTILNQLADDEIKHQELILRLQQEQHAPAPETSILGDARQIFQDMKGDPEEFSFDLDYVQMYEKARDFEKRNYDFYLEKAQLADDGVTKTFLLTLAAEEEKHFRLLEHIVEFLAQPDTWLENAEFHHLEEY